MKLRRHTALRAASLLAAGFLAAGLSTPASAAAAPLASVASGSDVDQDGLEDAEEFEVGTNTQDPDTDDDGVYDEDELDVYKTDPLNEDTDGDGHRDGAEVFGWKTSPTDPSSKPGNGGEEHPDLPASGAPATAADTGVDWATGGALGVAALVGFALGRRRRSI